MLDTNKYAVTVEKNGNVTIDGKEKNENGNFIFYNDRNKGQITITKKWLDDKENSERPELTVMISTQKTLEARSAFFRDNYISGYNTYGPLYYVDSNYKTKITGTFSRNKDLTEDEVKEKGAKRLDREYNNPNAEYKIYGWIEEGEEENNFYWWTNGEVAIMTDSSNKLFYEMRNVQSIDTKGINTSNVTDMSYMFSPYTAEDSSTCMKLTKLDISNFDTGNVTNMSWMFYNCNGLTELDVSNFNTNSVTNMQSMFDGCISLKELDVSNFNTSSVTTMQGMFYNCNRLTELDVSNFDTSSVTTMRSMFSKCSNLIELDVSNFDTSNVTNMSYMFRECSGLTELDVSNFDTGNVTNMSCMFYNCNGLTELDISNFDTSSVTTMQSMFYNCNGLTELDVSHFDTGNVTNMSSMFYNCNGLKELDVSNFNTSSVTNMGFMFMYCKSLIELNVSNFNTSSVTNMQDMFCKCESLSELDVSKFDTSSVTNMDQMFFDCNGLTESDVSNFNTSKVTDMHEMFFCCENLTELDVSNFDTSSVTNMFRMFRGCSKLTTIDVSKFDTSKVTRMDCMFDGCSGLTELDVSKFNTSMVRDMSDMFFGCINLTKLDVSKFDTNNVTNMRSMFRGCSGLTQLDVSNFDTSSVTDMESMFSSCSSLETIYASNKFSTDNLNSYDYIFSNCYSLVGGNGTKCNGSYYINKEYIRIDKPGEPGYFTEKTPTTASINNDEIVEFKVVALQEKKFMAPNVVETDDVITYSSADEHYDDKGNKVEWVKDGDTWEYTFYVDDPYADWYVWEDPVPEGYEANYTKFNLGEVKDQKATITNYTPENETFVEYGDLKITKKLFKRENDTETELTKEEDNTEFTFTVTLTAPEGREDEISGTKIFGNYVFKNGVGTIKLRAGEFAIISDLPAGTTYKVQEKQLSGYTCFNEESGIITKDEIKEVVANNYKEIPDSSTPTEPEKTVDVTIAKKVTGNFEKDDSYTLEVALYNLKPETKYYLSNNESFVSDRNGSADITITLKNNESVSIQNIPVGSKYKVYEKAGNYISSYFITDSNNVGAINNSASSNTKNNTALSTATETADEGENVIITFTNNKIVTQNLKLAKVVTDTNDKNSYIFNIEFGNMEENSSFNSSVGKVTAEANGKAEITIYLAGGEEAEFYSVPVGTTYRVTELASTAIASYTITDQNGTNKIAKESDANNKAKKALSTDIETVNEGEEATVTFTNDTVNQEPDSVSTSIGVTKEVLKMDGTKFEDCEDTFTFEIKADNEDNPMPTNTSVTITGNGDASFGEITFEETGTYSYKITEKKGTLEYYDYDETVYSVVYEVTNPEGLLEITKSVKKNGFMGDVIAFINNVSKIDVEILKQDEDRYPLKEATLQILDSDKKVVDEWVTDGQGHVKKLAPGKYILHEEKAPFGYYKIKDFNFTVTKDGKILVDSQEVEKIIVADNLVKGQITLTKTGEVLDKVTLKKDKTLGYSTYMMNYVTGTLNDATFELYAREDIVTASGKVVYKANEKVAEQSTDADGIAIFDDLYLGNYYVVETNAPESFEPNEEEIDLVLSYENDEEKVVFVDEEVNNARMKLDLSVTKNEKGNIDQKLKGAIYGVYNVKAIKNIKADTLLSIAQTDENGYAKFDIDLPMGKYYVKEIKAPKGYKLSTEVQEVEFKETKEVNLVFEDDYTKVTIKKLDAETGKDVIGATLQVLDKDKNVVEAYNSEGTQTVKLEWTTEQAIDENGNPVVDENGNPVAKEVTFTKLPIGTYILHEEKAPEGYEKAKDITFTVKEDGIVEVDGKEVNELIMIDLKTKEEPSTPDNSTVENNTNTNNTIETQDKSSSTSDNSTTNNTIETQYKVPATGDKIVMYLLIDILSGITLIIALKKKTKI